MYFYSSTCRHSVMPAMFVEDAFFFLPFYNFSFLGKNQVFIGVWVEIQVFDLIPLVLLSVFMPIQSCFHNYSSVVEFEVRDCDASICSFIVQDVYLCMFLGTW